MCSMFLFKWLLERNDLLICIAILSCHHDLICFNWCVLKFVNFGFELFSNMQ